MGAISGFSESLVRLNQIGIALSSERDLDRLLGAILREARTFTRAEAGTLYGVEPGGLRFLAVQNEALRAPPGRGLPLVDRPGELLPLTTSSMAGYVGITGRVIDAADVYELSADRPYHFNPEYDRRTGYRSRSMLLVPLKEPGGAVVGVLQLINARHADGRIGTFDPQNTELVLSLASQAAVALRNAQLTAELKAAYLDTVVRLSVAAEYKDHDTANHLRRMAHVSVIVAEALGWTDEQTELLRYAAPMHDIGKIAVPEAILQKPGRLTPEEYEQVKQHTVLGAQLFDGATAPVLRLSATIALTHHERHDGTGYPKGLRGEDIPPAGRIVAIADVFDALYSARCYKPAFSIERCLQMIQEGAGTAFHPHVVAAFIRRIDDVLAVRNRYTVEAAQVEVRAPM